MAGRARWACGGMQQHMGHGMHHAMQNGHSMQNGGGARGGGAPEIDLRMRHPVPLDPVDDALRFFQGFQVLPAVSCSASATAAPRRLFRHVCEPVRSAARHDMNNKHISARYVELFNAEACGSRDVGVESGVTPARLR